MLEGTRSKLTYANVMSTIAVFVALGGGAVYAADQIEGSDIERNAVKDRHLAADTIGGSELEQDIEVPVTAVTRELRFTVGAGQTASKFQGCNPGEVATGGGWQHFPGPGFAYGQTQVEQDGPLVENHVPGAWRVALMNTADAAADYVLYVICTPTVEKAD